MARICEICCRDYNSANSVSHSNIKTKRRQLVNLQIVKIDGKAARVCTRCVRTIKKGIAEKAAKLAKAAAAKKPVVKKVAKKPAKKVAKKK